MPPHVADASNPDCDRQLHVVYETLRELGVTDKTMIKLQTVYLPLIPLHPSGSLTVLTFRHLYIQQLIEELKELVVSLNATGIVCDDELSPAQMKNLEMALDCKVMDRTMVILAASVR